MRRSFPWLWVAVGLSLAVWVGLTLFGQPLGYRVPWLMLPVGLLAVAWGFWLAALLAVFGVAVEALLSSGAGGQAWHLIPWLGGVMLLGAWLSSRLGFELYRAYQRQQTSSQQLALLVAALEELSALEDRRELLRSLPGVLNRLGEGHVSVWTPQEDGFRLFSGEGSQDFPERLPGNSIVGRCYRLGAPVYLPDVRKDPEYVRAAGSSVTSELALPLLERGEQVAVLNLERSSPFSPEEREGLQRFARAVGQTLSTLAERSEAVLLSRLAATLAVSEEPWRLAQKALALLTPALRVRGAALFMQQGEQMVPLALHGEAQRFGAALERMSYGSGLAWRVYENNQPIWVEHYPQTPGALSEFVSLGLEAVLLYPVPVGVSKRARVILALGSGRSRRWLEAERRMLEAVCRTLGLALEAALARERTQVLLGLSREVTEATPERVYQGLLEAAVRLVPGAEKGSLMVREGDQYRFRATVGFDYAALSTSAYDDTVQETWYGRPLEDWVRGEPRLLSNPQTILETSRQSFSAQMSEAGEVDKIHSNLCLPIPYQGEVLAILNLDNLHDPQAFDEDSLSVARLFAAPLASLLHQVRYRRLLELAAHTDVLTALPNRRAFDRVILDELSLARRHDYPVALLLMDLKGFKPINDTLGHAKGDQALIQVAQTLFAEQRGGDKLFRWGGDEFAAILPYTPLEGALVVARRYAKSVAQICIDGYSLGINVGIAIFPHDAWEEKQLLNLADQRMYQAKEQGLSVYAGVREHRKDPEGMN